TGSLMLGGVIAVLAIILRKELLIPVLCGIFLIENISVMLQVGVFKYRKRKFGLEYAQNNRLFKMSPLHHHYQKEGYHESKIVNRVLTMGVLWAIIRLIAWKTRYCETSSRGRWREWLWGCGFSEEKRDGGCSVG